MATISEIKAAFEVLLAAYPDYKPGPGTLKLYAGLLAGYPAAAIDAAVQAWIKAEKWFPKIAELEPLAAEQARLTRYTTLDEWRGDVRIDSRP